MKSLTLILFVLTLSLAQCVSPPIEWVGDWEFKSSTLPEECIPQSIVTSSLGAHVVFKWIWASTQGCKKSGAAGGKGSEVIVPMSNSFYLRKPDAVVPFKFTLNGNSALTETGNNAESTFIKKVPTPSVNWAGTWNIQTRYSSEECYPKDKITISTTSSTMTLSWIWDVTEACSKKGFAGVFYESTVAMTSGNDIELFFLAGEWIETGTFSVSGDTAIFGGLVGFSCDLKRETPQGVNWVGTWDLKTISSVTSCLPLRKVVITSSGSSITYSWNWDSNEDCKQVGLSGKSFAKTLSTPSGNSITLQDGELSVTLILNGEAITFVSKNGGSGTFARQTSIPPVNWAGNWVFKSTTEPEECIPNKIVTSVLGSHVIFDWVWDSSQACKNAGVDGKKNSRIIVPTGTTVTLMEPSSSSPLFKFTLNLFSALVETGSHDKSAKSTFERKAVTSSTNWDGTWIIKTRESSEECYPKDKIIVSTTGNLMTLSWVWDDTCYYYGVAGVVHESIIAIDNDDMINLSFNFGGKVRFGRFSVNGNTATFEGIYAGRSCNLVREPPKPQANWAGTWILKTTSTGTSSCYPKEQIYVSSSEDSVTCSWVWDSNDNCKQLGLSGKPFTKTVPTPKGNSITLNLVVEGSETSVVFTVNEDIATFKGLKEASCTFDRQTEKLVVNWAGTWIIKTTSPAEACYPKEKVTISTASTSITYNWVWDSSEGCNKLGLSGKTFEKTTPVPNGNLVPLHFQAQEAEVYGILVINGDKASFNNLEGASCTFERKIDDDKKEEKKSNGFIIWLIIFVVTISGVGFCIYRKRKEDQLLKSLGTDSPTKSFLNA